MNEILKVIERIRDSFDGSVEVYTQGSCIKFAMILKEIFPQGNILYDSDHAVFLLDGRCYDITGEVPRATGQILLETYGPNKMYDLMNLKYSIYKKEVPSASTVIEEASTDVECTEIHPKVLHFKKMRR